MSTQSVLKHLKLDSSYKRIAKASYCGSEYRVFHNGDNFVLTKENSSGITLINTVEQLYVLVDKRGSTLEELMKNALDDAIDEMNNNKLAYFEHFLGFMTYYQHEKFSIKNIIKDYEKILNKKFVNDAGIHLQLSDLTNDHPYISIEDMSDECNNACMSFSVGDSSIIKANSMAFEILTD